MEEHFPHSMAKAVMDAAKEHGLTHEEMHSKVEYIVAHGISTTDRRTEKQSSEAIILYLKMRNARFRQEKKEIFENLPEEYSHLYLGNRGRTGSGNLY